MRIPKDVELRKGAVVMLVRGIDDTLVTGSRGEGGPYASLLYARACSWK